MPIPPLFVWTNAPDLAAAVIAARTMAGLSQAKLAKRARVGRKFVVELERGKSTLRVDKVMQVLAEVRLGPVLFPVEVLASIRRSNG